MGDLLIQFFNLPLLTARLGVDVLRRAFEGDLVPGGSGGQGAGRSPGSTPSGSSGRIDAPSAAREPASAVWGAGSPNDGPPYVTGGPLGADQRRATKEDREMSCNCCGSDYCSCESGITCPPVVSDKSLGGRCCVKVVQYTIISVRSSSHDNDRIIVEPTTVAFSDDMDDAAFTAWVISENCDTINKVPPGDRKYLRVAYQVFARFAEEEPNYCQDQVAALWDIARRLPPPDEKSGGKGKAS